LKKKVQLINQSDGKNQRKLAEQFVIGKKQNKLLSGEKKSNLQVFITIKNCDILSFSFLRKTKFNFFKLNIHVVKLKNLDYSLNVFIL
jgi:hypothetical protein